MFPSIYEYKDSVSPIIFHERGEACGIWSFSVKHVKKEEENEEKEEEDGEEWR